MGSVRNYARTRANLFYAILANVKRKTTHLFVVSSFTSNSHQFKLIAPLHSAAKHSSSQKDFPLCVEGRKKAFDQACVPICTNAELIVTSFEGCQIIARGKGAQGVSWCRKGYDSILQSVGPFLNEHAKKLKQIEEESIEESVPVQSEPVKNDAMKHVDLIVESNYEPATKEAVVAADNTNVELELEESAEAADHTVVVESTDPVQPVEQHEHEAKEAVVVDSSREDESATAVDAEHTQDNFGSDENETEIHQTTANAAAESITPDDAGETGKETEL